MRYLVIGAAGHAQEVAWSLRCQLGGATAPGDIVFFDDGIPPGPLASGLGLVAGDLDAVPHYAFGEEEARLVLGIGLPSTKEAVVARLAGLGIPWATVTHPHAVIGPGVTIGDGSYIGAGAIVTVNVRIGEFVTVNLHGQVAHDDELEDFVTLHPDVHLAGNVTIGRGSELGTSAVVTPGNVIGPYAVLGAGCIAVTSLVGGEVYVGMPARPSSRRATLSGEAARPLAMPHTPGGGA